MIPLTFKPRQTLSYTQCNLSDNITFRDSIQWYCILYSVSIVFLCEKESRRCEKRVVGSMWWLFSHVYQGP
jgi:hypothetical protein